MKKEAKEIREEIIAIVEKETPSFPLEQPLNVEVEVFENWLTVEGKIKRKDVMNREKFLIDSVFIGLGVDDKYIYNYTIKKIQSDKEKSRIKIKPIQL